MKKKLFESHSWTRAVYNKTFSPPQTKFEKWCLRKMTSFHNKGLKYKNPVKREYFMGMSNGYAQVLDQLIFDREKGDGGKEKI